MKTKLAGLLAGLLLATQVHAAVLTAATPVYAQPDASSAVISVLNAGTSPSPSNASGAVAPEGWMPIDVAGPFVAYINGRELDKNLNIRPNAPLVLHPKDGAPILIHYAKGMKIQITGIRGHWMQVKFEQNLIGYLHTTPAAIVQAPAPVPSVAPSPTSPASINASATYGPAPGGGVVDTGSGSADMPRSFQGKFVSSHHLFELRKPYDFQLNDDSGSRFAYLDLSKILVTDVLDRYLNQEVSVYGLAHNMKGTKTIVIEVESLHLR